jgi:hypothetical protein
MAILPVTELNASDVPQALEALRELPLELVNVGLRWFVPPAAGAEYERVMDESFGVDGSSWRGFQFAWPEGTAANGTMQGLVSVLGAARRRRLLDVHRGGPGSRSCPQWPAEVPAYFNEPRGRSGTTSAGGVVLPRRWSRTATCASAATSRTT